MVGSVNEQFYTRYRTPGASYKKKGEKAQFDYTWQENLMGTARLPIAYRENKPKPAPVYTAPMAAPYTSSK